MWTWISVVVIGLALAILAVWRNAELRPRGFVLIGIALLLTIGIELLIRTETISVGFGSELLGILLILLAAWAIWKLPRPHRGSGNG